MSEHSQLEKAITALEAQRSVLGDAAVNAAQMALRQQMASSADAPRLITSPPTCSASSLVGERKLVTVMFADICGFTAMSETTDPEAVRDLVNACFDRLVPLIHKYEGTVDKFMGDGIMALFGAPASHENDPERALRAALDMVDTVEAFNKDYRLSLGLHFGINTGLVVAGPIGTEGRREYSVMGDAVNLAARLEDLAERGEILVGPDTHRLVASVFRFEVLQPIRVKGKADPVHVYRLIGLKTKRKSTRGLAAKGISSPLVGRDAEYETLSRCIERLKDGQGGIVSIFGEAGAGKSRLVAEVRQRYFEGVFREDAGGTSPPSTGPIKWLQGSAVSFGQTISYWPFQGILWQFAGITEDDSESVAWRKLETHVAALFHEKTGDVLPYLATLLSFDIADPYAERVRYLDGDAMGHQVFLASRHFFERLARMRPLVLVFEDLHWMDASSDLLLEHLLPLVESVPLLICGVGRPYSQTPAAHLATLGSQGFQSRYAEIRLEPLSRSHTTTLVKNLFDNEHFPAQLQELIVTRAEGNPFFVEEIVRSLIEVGAVTHSDETGKWELTAGIDALAIPDTVQGVIMARVDRLDEHVRQVLKTAAVIGRSFFYRVLRAIMEADHRLDEELAELQTVQLIREKQRAPELEFMFRHALAQEATYDSVLLQQRRELHAQVASVIEVLFADRLEEFYGLLAYHYARAELWAKAHDYLMKAGDQAGRMAADAEALVHYQQALTAYQHAFGDQWDPLQRATLERKMGQALFRRGEHALALRSFQQALLYLGSPLPTTRWEVRLAIPCQVLRQVIHRLFRPLFFRRVHPTVKAAVEEEVRLSEAIGWIDAFESDERTLLIALRIMNVAESYGCLGGMAIGAMALGLISDLTGHFRLAGQYHERALPYAEQSEHSGTIGLVCIGLALHNMCLSDWNAVAVHAERGASLYRETGDLHNWAYITYLRTAALSFEGNFSGALSYCREIVSIGRDAGDPQVQCWGLSVQGYMHRMLGQCDEAVMALRRASEFGEATRDYRFSIWARGEIARHYLREGDVAMALAAAKDAEKYQTKHNTVSLLWLPYWNALAEVYIGAAEEADEAERPERLKKAAIACRAALRHARTYRGVLPEAIRLQGTLEWLRHRPEAARQRWGRSLAVATSLGQHYDCGMTHSEMGYRLNDSAHLLCAEDILGRLIQPAFCEKAE